MNEDLIPDHMADAPSEGPAPTPPSPKVSPSTKQKVLDFVERVGSSALLAGYGAYVALPHVSTNADLKVGALAAAGAAAKYIIKYVAVYQAANLDA